MWFESVGKGGEERELHIWLGEKKQTQLWGGTMILHECGEEFTREGGYSTESCQKIGQRSIGRKLDL